jgi:hypothetical protein
VREGALLAATVSAAVAALVLALPAVATADAPSQPPASSGALDTTGAPAPAAGPDAGSPTAQPAAPDPTTTTTPATTPDDTTTPTTTSDNTTTPTDSTAAPATDPSATSTEDEGTDAGSPTAAASATATSACEQQGTETVTTDKADYAPEETVHIGGTGYAAACTVQIEVTRPDGTIVQGDGSFTPGVDTATTSADGTFTDDYRLDGVEGLYRVRVLGVADTVLASVTFTDQLRAPTPSDPRAVFVAGNVTTCAAAGFPGTIQMGSPSNTNASDGIVSGTVATNAGTVQPGRGQEVDITITAGANVVIDAVVVKGGPAYNVYSNPLFLPPTLLSPQHYISPFNGGGNVPTISHWFVCYHPATPPPAGSLGVFKTVIGPNGIPVTPLPTSYTALVNCNDLNPAHQNVTVTVPGGGGTGVPVLMGIPAGTICTVVEQNTGSFPAGTVVTYNPTGANTTGVTITATTAVAVSITNDFSATAVQTGSVQLLKAVVPSGASGPAAFTATVSCDDGTLATVTMPAAGGPGVPVVTAKAGALCLIEENAASIPPGWAVTYSVNGGTATSTPPTVTIAFNQTITVTITNTAPGSITIVKDAVPDGPATFDFTASAPLTPASFTLDDDGNPTPFLNTQTFTGVPAGGPYTITETPTAGFTLGSPVSCTGSSTVTQTTNGITITLAPGDNVVCTFVNTQDGSITIVKDAVPNGPTTFDFTASAPLTPASFTLDDDGDNANEFSNTQVFADVAPGASYTFTESPTDTFTLTSVSCTGGSDVATSATGVTVTLAAGENVVCTFVNEQTAVEAATAVDATAAAEPPTAASGLAFTGSDSRTLGAVGLVAVVVGATLTVAGGRRRRRHART